MTTQITGGEISFGRTMKTGEYENKRGDVKVAFSVGEGEDHAAVLDKAAELAKAKLAELLDPPLPGAPKRGRPPNPPPAPVANKATLAAEAAVKAGADPAAVLNPPPIEKAISAAKPVAEAATVAKSEPPIDPAAVADEFAAEAPPITDKDLTDAATRKNAEHDGKAGPTIRQLVGKFVAPPGRIVDIKPEHRPEFLKQLKAL